MRKAHEYIEFLITEYERIASNIEVEGFSSSQGTTTSSQGPLVIDENYQDFTEKITCEVDPEYGNSSIDNSEIKFSSLPSSLLSPDVEHFDFTPPNSIPLHYPTPKWNDYRYGSTSQSLLPSPSPSSPHSFSQQPLSTYQYMTPQVDDKNFNQQTFQQHCPSCVCYSSHYSYRGNYKSSSSDYLLTQTIHDPYMGGDIDLSSWA